MDSLVALAPTGKSAVAMAKGNVPCGKTVWAGLRFRPFSGPPAPGKARTETELQLRQEWKDKGVKFLAIDEVGMLSAQVLAETDEMCRIISGIDRPFGGLHIVSCGDFTQKKPAGGSALWQRNVVSHVDGTAAKGISASATAVKEGLARKQWETLLSKVVVILVESKRFEDDPEWGALLERLRVGKCTVADGETINARLLHKLLNKDDFKHAPLLSSFNFDINAWNLSTYRGAAEHFEETVYTWEHDDYVMTATGKKTQGGRDAQRRDTTPISETYRRGLYGLLRDHPKFQGNNVSETQGRHHSMHFFKGIEYLINENDSIASSLGLVNGMRCVGVKILFHEDEESDVPVAYNKANPGPHVLTHAPRCILVRLHSPGLLRGRRISLPSKGSGADLLLPLGVIPIFPSPSRQSITIDIASLDPALVDRGLRPTYNIVRVGFALSLGYAFSDYKIQGESLDAAICVLSRNNRGDTRGAYVILSRLRSLQSLALLQWVPLSMLQQPLEPDLAAEEARLHRIDIDARCKSKDLIGAFVGRLQNHRNELEDEGGDEAVFIDTLIGNIQVTLKAAEVEAKRMKTAATDMPAPRSAAAASHQPPSSDLLCAKCRKQHPTDRCPKTAKQQQRSQARWIRLLQRPPSGPSQFNLGESKEEGGACNLGILASKSLASNAAVLRRLGIAFPAGGLLPPRMARVRIVAHAVDMLYGSPLMNRMKTFFWSLGFPGQVIFTFQEPESNGPEHTQVRRVGGV